MSTYSALCWCWGAKLRKTDTGGLQTHRGYTDTHTHCSVLGRHRAGAHDLGFLTNWHLSWKMEGWVGISRVNGAQLGSSPYRAARGKQNTRETKTKHRALQSWKAVISTNASLYLEQSHCVRTWRSCFPRKNYSRCQKATVGFLWLHVNNKNCFVKKYV